MEHNDPYWYLHVGRASDLTGRDRVYYRLFEMLPAILSLSTLALFAALSFLRPVWAAYLTIAFSIYWLFKTIYLSVHLRHNYKRMRHNMGLDWNVRLKDLRYKDVVHLIIFPLYLEDYEVVAGSVRALLRAAWNPKTIAVVVSVEARAGEGQRAIAERILKEFGPQFLDFQVVVHPANRVGRSSARVRISHTRRRKHARAFSMRAAYRMSASSSPHSMSTRWCTRNTSPASHGIFSPPRTPHAPRSNPYRSTTTTSGRRRCSRASWHIQVRSGR